MSDPSQAGSGGLPAGPTASSTPDAAGGNEQPGLGPARPKRRWRRWVLWLSISAVVLLGGLTIAAILVGRHFEPYIREQAIKYLETRFESKVELEGLHVRAPRLSVFRLLRAGGPELVEVYGEGLRIRHHGRTDLPPLFVLKDFSASVDLRTLFSGLTTVALVNLDGMEMNIPPKGERPELSPKDAEAEQQNNDAQEAASRNTGVIIEHVVIRNGVLSLLPKNRAKDPLRFDLHEVRLDSAGKDVAMKYTAQLTNPKPVGEITSEGTFGPWAAGEPSATPLAGDYRFENADLSIFSAIAGILRSTGSFDGQLGLITARGEAEVPDFRLKMSGNPVPLRTSFEVLVDGTNGNTELKPVKAVLGSTRFTTSGGVIRYDGDRRRTITLDVAMPQGNLRDVLRLAMKGEPFMEGTLNLQTKIGIPPLSGKVKEKLLLSGTFDVSNGKFLRSNIQDQIDSMSRRGQGQPKNQEIDEVVSHMSGKFDLANEAMTFEQLAFAIPGAAINISGTYDMGKDMLDFHGSAALDAKISQTMSGWKRWVLKPADPFFAKNGAGTYLKIQIVGSAKKPKFGLDKGSDDARGAAASGKTEIRKLEKYNIDPSRNSLRRNEQ